MKGEYCCALFATKLTTSIGQKSLMLGLGQVHNAVAEISGSLCD